MSVATLVRVARRGRPSRVSVDTLPTVQKTLRMLARTANLRILFELGRTESLDSNHLAQLIDCSKPELCIALGQLRKLGVVVSQADYSTSLQMHSITQKGKNAYTLLFN